MTNSFLEPSTQHLHFLHDSIWFKWFYTIISLTNCHLNCETQNFKKSMWLSSLISPVSCAWAGLECLADSSDWIRHQDAEESSLTMSSEVRRVSSEIITHLIQCWIQIFFHITGQLCSQIVTTYVCHSICERQKTRLGLARLLGISGPLLIYHFGSHFKPNKIVANISSIWVWIDFMSETWVVDYKIFFQVFFGVAFIQICVGLAG